MRRTKSSQTTYARERRLRREMTAAEVAVWQCLRRRQLGVRFRRQHPIGPFIVDFVSLSNRLVVELDGQPHEDDWSGYDDRRTHYLEGLGYRVPRFENREVYDDLDAVIDLIAEALGAVHDRS